MTYSVPPHHAGKRTGQLVLRFGVVPLVVMITLLSVVASVLLLLALDMLLKGRIVPMDIVFSMVIPALVAPPVTYVFIRLMHQLELAEQQLWTLATVDELSGVYTRRYWSDIAQRESARAIRMAQSIGVLMIDADHFKQINDVHGHAKGDQVLRELGRILLTVSRSTDAVGRYGGEEFVIVLPGISLEEAMLVAERLRVCIERELAPRAGLEQPVTVSIGVAVSGGESLLELVGQSDAALYAAKRDGRNCVRCHSACVPGNAE